MTLLSTCLFVSFTVGSVLGWWLGRKFWAWVGGALDAKRRMDTLEALAERWGKVTIRRGDAV